MEFRDRAKLFVERSSFLERFRNRNKLKSGEVSMTVQTKSGQIKELNSNGEVVSHKLKAPRKLKRHCQVIIFTNERSIYFDALFGPPSEARGA